MQKNYLAALEAKNGEDFSVGHVDLRKLRSGAIEKLEKGKRKNATTGLILSAKLNGERNQLILLKSELWRCRLWMLGKR